MSRLFLVTILLLVIASQGCSSQEVYDALQTREKNECLKVPESQYQECMDRAGHSYDEFKRNREGTEK